MPPLLLLLCLAHPANLFPLLGLDTGNPAADKEAGMWLVRACYLLLCRRGAVNKTNKHPLFIHISKTQAALVATLSAAIPVAFLSPGLGFRRRREVAGLGSGGLEWVHRVVRQQQS